MKISIVTPVYKAEEILPELYARLIKSVTNITDDFEIIMVNDGSPGNDWKVICDLAQNDKRVKGINLSRNFGQHYAITAGLDNCNGDWIVVMDCDLQDQPEEINKLYTKALEGYDLVMARREFRQDKFFKKFTSAFFYIIYDYLTESKTDRTIANFGIYSRKCIDSFCKFHEQSRAFPLIINLLGFQRGFVNVEHAFRFAGNTSYTWKKLISFALSNIISQSNKPLKISVFIGFLLSLFGFFYGIYLIAHYFLTGIPVVGWTSMMVALFFIGGLILANIGVLGIYIGKIFDESKKRPLYIIMDTLNF